MTKRIKGGCNCSKIDLDNNGRYILLPESRYRELLLDSTRCEILRDMLAAVGSGYTDTEPLRMAMGMAKPAPADREREE